MGFWPARKNLSFSEPEAAEPQGAKFRQRGGWVGAARVKLRRLRPEPQIFGHSSGRRPAAPDPSGAGSIPTAGRSWHPGCRPVVPPSRGREAAVPSSDCRTASGARLRGGACAKREPDWGARPAGPFRAVFALRASLVLLSRSRLAARSGPLPTPLARDWRSARPRFRRQTRPGRWKRARPGGEVPKPRKF